MIDLQTAVLNAISNDPFPKCLTYYDSDGDCFEVLFSDESYKTERVDEVLTVFYGQESKEIVGCVIKGMRLLLTDVLKRNPGFVFEVEDGNIELSILFTAAAWKDGDKVTGKRYKKLRSQAAERSVKIPIPQGIQDLLAAGSVAV